MIDETDILVVSPYLSRLDLSTKIAAIEKGQELIVPEIYIPDGTRSVQIQIPRQTSENKSLWADSSNEVIFQLEYSKDGRTWYPAGAFGAIGGIHTEVHPLSGKVFEVPVTTAKWNCDFDGVKYRITSKCDSKDSQIIKPLVLFQTDPAPREVSVKKNSVGYVSVQATEGGTVTSLTTSTLSIGAGSNRAVAAIDGHYRLQTVTAMKFGGSGGTSMNAVPGASLNDASGWARMNGYLLKESEGVTSDGTLYAAYSASTSAYLTGVSVDNAKGVYSGSGTAPSATTLGAPISANVTSAANQLVIGAALTFTNWATSPSITVGSGQTQRSTRAIGTSTRMTVTTETASSSSESTSFNPNDYAYYPYYGESTRTVMIAWSIEEETGGGGGTPYTAELTAASFGMTPATLLRKSGFMGLLTAPAFNLTPQALNVKRGYRANLSAAVFNLTPQALLAKLGYVAALSAAVFNLPAQALNVLTGYRANLSAPAFNFTGQAVTHTTFTGYVAQLTAASFNLTPADLTVLRGYVAVLTAAVFNFTGRALTWLNPIYGAATNFTRHVKRSILRPLTRHLTDRGQDDE